MFTLLVRLKKATDVSHSSIDELRANTGFPDGRFPQVEICGEGVYCCRVGENACCDDDSNLVYLDEDGILESTKPLTTTEESSSATADSTTSSSEAEPTTSSSDSPETTTSDEFPEFETPTAGAGEEESSDEESSDPDDSVGFKAGLGVGIPLAAGLAGLVTWWMIRRQRGKHIAEREPSHPPTEEHKGYADYHATPRSHNIQPAELSAWNTDFRHELPGSQPMHSR